MTNETLPAELPAPPSPERAAYLRRALVGIVGSVMDQALGEVAAASSTGSPQDRLMVAALRPWIPKLRERLLSSLSSVDGAGLERTAGAVALAIESVIAQAPGSPEPRFRFDWDGSALVLVPYPEADRG